MDGIPRLELISSVTGSLNSLRVLIDKHAAIVG